MGVSPTAIRHRAASRRRGTPARRRKVFVSTPTLQERAPHQPLRQALQRRLRIDQLGPPVQGHEVVQTCKPAHDPFSTRTQARETHHEPDTKLTTTAAELARRVQPHGLVRHVKEGPRRRRAPGRTCDHGDAIDATRRDGLETSHVDRKGCCGADLGRIVGLVKRRPRHLPPEASTRVSVSAPAPWRVS